MDKAEDEMQRVSCRRFIRAYRECAPVHPHVFHVVKGNRVSGPDDIRVDVADGDVSDDDVLGVLDAQTLALDSALAVGANDGLVGADDELSDTGLSVLHL